MLTLGRMPLITAIAGRDYHYSRRFWFERHEPRLEFEGR